MGIAAERKAWWSAQRSRYNVTLILAAPVSAALLFGVWWAFEDRLPCLDITAVSAIFGATLFLFGLILANICYFLGPIAERIIRPNDTMVFRHRAYGVGVAFSLLLIFSPPIVNLAAALLDPPCTDEFGQLHVLQEKK